MFILTLEELQRPTAQMAESATKTTSLHTGHNNTDHMGRIEYHFCSLPQVITWTQQL